ncbi:MAG: flagellar motor switch protein FliN [Gammaproteobacteria bacterium]|jgi:flagellar motor switch protein FliN/FliY|nr:flagellar motor switch protein FliN [Gammaproteobacteria bacterium]
MSDDIEAPMGQTLEKALESGAAAAPPAESEPGKGEAASAAAGAALTADSGSEINLDSLLDVPVTLSVEIGRSKLAIRDLVSLNQGSVIELDREVNEPLDLLVNGTLMARGEVVVVDGQFGLRLIDIVSPRERLKKLK